MNLPYLNVHTVLAGYADIWMAAAFGSAVMALQAWQRTGARSYAILALALAVMCTQLKIPGLIMGGIVLAVFFLSLLRLPKVAAVATIIMLAMSSLFLVVVGIDLDLPGLGQVQISAAGVTLPYIGTYEFSYHAATEPMIRSTLLMLNWNLLWYLFIGAAVARIALGGLFTLPSIAMRGILLALAFILFVYYFTDRYEFALDYTQLNRALIYLVPLLVCYVFQWFSNSGEGRAQ
jgi:hypothetical protein